MAEQRSDIPQVTLQNRNVRQAEIECTFENDRQLEDFIECLRTKRKLTLTIRQVGELRIPADIAAIVDCVD